LLLWRGTSVAVRDISENGLFLGMFDSATYSSVEVPLAPGDWGLLYTDGIPETTNSDQVEFGAERFRQFLISDRNTSANQLADRLLEELSRWSAHRQGEDLEDDITMVAIHVSNDP
jgi:sigma-B regulation protein RsbU (phosphoserine phosphatase)